MKALAALMSVTAASLSSFGSRSCSVPNARSDQPRAKASGRTPVSPRAMRRIGPDVLDPELLKGPADLGR
jgi:hypothetical protein